MCACTAFCLRAALRNMTKGGDGGGGENHRRHSIFVFRIRRAVGLGWGVQGVLVFYIEKIPVLVSIVFCVCASMGTRSPVKAFYTRRSSCQPDDRLLLDNEVVQGRILWLPPKDQLPPKAVKRAHGKGIVDEGIFNHPVVVISRPVDEVDMVHFHIVSRLCRPERTIKANAVNR